VSAADQQRRETCPCLCHESGPPDLHTAPGTTCPCKPFRGMRFAHGRFRQSLPGLRIDEQPAEVCRVTRVTGTTVYYRTRDGEGGVWCTGRDTFTARVAEVLPDA